jgi:ribosomal protein S18 acetylase RimI-like enzyme
MKLLPANEFALEELTDAYNRTRTDYIIPMPMNPGRLLEYITLFDVSLPASRVAVLDGKIVGLGMLGIRPGQGWITRLGVLPEGRRRGVGGAILQQLLEQAAARDVNVVWLEVIHGNEPAHQLFKKFGFEETRELLVGRRPPNVPRNVAIVMNARIIDYLQHEEVIEHHCVRCERANWLNDVSSMRNIRKLATATIEESTGSAILHEAPRLSGIEIEFQDGSQGWVTFQVTAHQLKRINVEVGRGDPTETTSSLLQFLHRLHSSQDAIVENIPEDKQWIGFQQAGYFETFRRIEMARSL